MQQSMHIEDLKKKKKTNLQHSSFLMDFVSTFI